MNKLCKYCKRPCKIGKDPITGTEVSYCDNRLCILKMMAEMDNPIPKGWIITEEELQEEEQ